MSEQYRRVATLLFCCAVATMAACSTPVTISNGGSADTDKAERAEKARQAREKLEMQAADEAFKGQQRENARLNARNVSVPIPTPKGGKQDSGIIDVGNGLVARTTGDGTTFIDDGCGIGAPASSLISGRVVCIPRTSGNATPWTPDPEQTMRPTPTPMPSPTSTPTPKPTPTPTPTPTPKPTPVTTTVTINANHGTPSNPRHPAWLATGLFIRGGTAFKTRATGTITTVETNRTWTFGPDGAGWGNKVGGNAADVLDTSLPWACLIGNIGGGEPFYIGAGGDMQLYDYQSGELFLGINDWDVSNNTGLVTVEITYFPKQ